MPGPLQKLLRRRARHACGRCGSDFLCPIAWEPDGEEYWAIRARCGACGVWHAMHLTNSETAAWELELDRQERPIRRAIDRLDRERMARQAAGFIAALQRDLIDAADFA